MRAKEYLRQINTMQKRIDSLRDEVDKLRDSISHPKPINYDKDPVQGGSQSDGMTNTIAKYVDLEREIEQKVDELIMFRHKVVGEINQLKEANHIELLRLRYVDGYTFEQIACTMTYSFRQVLRIHGYALKEFDRVILHNIKMS